MSLVKKRLRIGGMTCVNCQNLIEGKLRRTAGVREATVDYVKGTAQVTYDDSVISFETVMAVIENLDYEVLGGRGHGESDVSRTVCFLVIIVSLYVLLQRCGILNLLVPSRLAETGMGYLMLFATGLVTSVHCIAMCGGINISQCIPQGRAAVRSSCVAALRPAFLYNLGRVISYSMIGLFLGTAGMVIGGGSGVGISTFVQGVLKLIAGALMVIMGVNMLGIFPWLRYLQPRLPRTLTRRLGAKKAKSRRPLFVGLLNGLMPCGPLQSMQIVALASGSPVTGMLSMFAFSLGTAPLMLGLGSLVAALGRRFMKGVMNIGAVLVVVLGLAMISQGGSLSGLFLLSGGSEAVQEEEMAEIADGVQIVNSTLAPGRYPNITVQAGVPVRWIIDAPAGSINGCNYKMIIKEYGVEYAFEQGENVIEFTPEKAGTYGYTCWMGMIRGNIFVVDQDGGAGGEVSASEAPVPAGYQIPTEELAVAEKKEENGETFQEVTIRLSKEGFSPAVAVLEKGVQAVWKVEVDPDIGDDGTALLIPTYSTVLYLYPGENEIYLTPAVDFEASTGDNAFYAYIKIVDDLRQVDEDAVREEVEAFETFIYPASVFESQGGASCCG